MRRLLDRVRSWWSRRTVQFRTSAVAASVTLLVLGLVVRFSTGVVGWLLLESVDTELRIRSATAAERVSAGQSPVDVAGGGVRVLDSSGVPLDELPPPGLDASQIDVLKEGGEVLDTSAPDGWHRWSGEVVPGPNGQPRLVAVGAALIGYRGALSAATHLVALGSVAAAGAVGLATWLVVRRCMRPVERLRVAASSLPEGRRLPVPEAHDELRALAEALNAMLDRRDADTERLRRFTGDAAHELRNPVASIRAQAEVAVVHPDPELAQETLRNVSSEAQRLSELVDGLLALARAESGTPPPPEPVDLAAAARAAADRWNMRGARPRVRLVLPGGSMVVLAAASEVSLVLDNLITNAQRHAKALVRLSVLPAADSIRLLADDDGPGIPEEHRQRVFDRFHRVRPDRARRTGGAGLGLALVAEAVRKRGGSARVLDSPEGGARIELRWPLPGPLSPDRR